MKHRGVRKRFKMRTQVRELYLEGRGHCLLRPTISASILEKAEPEPRIEVLTPYLVESCKARTVRVKRRWKQGRRRGEALC